MDIKWDDLPAYACFVAKDADEEVYWYAARPVIDEGLQVWDISGHLMNGWGALEGVVLDGLWRDSLVERPVVTPVTREEYEFLLTQMAAIWSHMMSDLAPPRLPEQVMWDMESNLNDVRGRLCDEQK